MAKMGQDPFFLLRIAMMLPLERRKWDKELTSFDEGNTDVAIMKEFYANLYDPEDKSPK